MFETSGIKLENWLAGWFAGWLVCWLVCWLRQAGWLPGCPLKWPPSQAACLNPSSQANLPDCLNLTGSLSLKVQNLQNS